jgi:anti-anti-sigma factor
MSTIKREVRVHQVPDQVNATTERSFLLELQKCGEAERPRFVLDCSRVREMDIATIHLLLSSLEEVMKCNGDIRLAALNPPAEEMLHLAGVNRLFEIYPTVDGAVRSYHQRPASIAPLDFGADRFDRSVELAA